jgi:hypothetical protein
VLEPLLLEPLPLVEPAELEPLEEELATPVERPEEPPALAEAVDPLPPLVLVATTPELELPLALAELPVPEEDALTPDAEPPLVLEAPEDVLEPTEPPLEVEPPVVPEAPDEVVELPVPDAAALALEVEPPVVPEAPDEAVELGPVEPVVPLVGTPHTSSLLSLLVSASEQQSAGKLLGVPSARQPPHSPMASKQMFGEQHWAPPPQPLPLVKHGGLQTLLEQEAVESQQGRPPSHATPSSTQSAHRPPAPQWSGAAQTVSGLLAQSCPVATRHRLPWVLSQVSP